MCVELAEGCASALLGAPLRLGAPPRNDGGFFVVLQLDYLCSGSNIARPNEPTELVVFLVQRLRALPAAR